MIQKKKKNDAVETLLTKTRTLDLFLITQCHKILNPLILMILLLKSFAQQILMNLQFDDITRFNFHSCKKKYCFTCILILSKAKV